MAYTGRVIPDFPVYCVSTAPPPGNKKLRCNAKGTIIIPSLIPLLNVAMAYPGEGYKMSNYGYKTYTPEQMKEQWRESVERENKLTKTHSATKKTQLPCVSAAMKTNYFGTEKTYTETLSFDRTFHVEEGYCSKLKRDDLQHTQGLNVHAEEVNKSVPILMSSVYGHRSPLEVPDRKHVRVSLVKKEFYRSCGANVYPSQ